MAQHTRRIPAWMFGLIIAAALTVAILLISNALGFGDDPVVESLGSMMHLLG